MLDSECRERTETAESERRGVLTGGCGQTGVGGGRPARRARGRRPHPARGGRGARSVSRCSTQAPSGPGPAARPRLMSANPCV